MIELTKLKGSKFALNSDHIETMEETPDTVITLMNGHKYVVRERVGEIISLIESFRRNSSGYSAPGFYAGPEND
ncbi:MAG: flagellar FlbD family protein [Synergistaceae bacterium]|nr:flagellar FlbD family protein [Synergistaceae bacterium]